MAQTPPKTPNSVIDPAEANEGVRRSQRKIAAACQHEGGLFWKVGAWARTGTGDILAKSEI